MWSQTCGPPCVQKPSQSDLANRKGTAGDHFNCDYEKTYLKEKACCHSNTSPTLETKRLGIDYIQVWGPFLSQRQILRTCRKLWRGIERIYRTPRGGISTFHGDASVGMKGGDVRVNQCLYCHTSRFSPYKIKSPLWQCT